MSTTLKITVEATSETQGDYDNLVAQLTAAGFVVEASDPEQRKLVVVKHETT